MPELLDLQAFSRNEHKKFAAKTLIKVNVPVNKKLNVPVITLKKELEDQKIIEIYRKGKELRFAFKNGMYWVFI